MSEKMQTLGEALNELHELRQTFELRWSADQRAIKRWREVHPGNELVMPDHADLVVWLMERHRLLEKAFNRLVELMRAGDFHSDAVKEIYEQSAKAIEDYDRREAAGEEMSHEVRPRMPGGSDF